jgi:hypothetical protein
VTERPDERCDDSGEVDSAGILVGSSDATVWLRANDREHAPEHLSVALGCSPNPHGEYNRESGGLKGVARALLN